MDVKMKMKWCPAAACWIADLTDVNGNAIVLGVPLVTGADLLEQFGYLRLGGQLIVQTDNDLDAVPSFTSLGKEGHFYFLSP